ncbi:hypothetical protein FRACYDRAFT_244065 [Fragilariopsis cylindrus CCMP1102]|uniref:Uncharacterized protein n=1 Tax=Fragilariopsis cylindrus CCMP1102 TaxID=635003 RepID=A0A1E7F3N2_9STRA|nr:hypothetical protein FRACYDRAFT_244065 [Fragilariopsis cylindrus CCMP1102]|eukprot:OEU12791.1 hypothetical protein FRACYDRAFT_244065 [Fragilariopsis cylindrus CCMP1102]
MITSVIGRRPPRLSIECIMIIAVTFMAVALITLHPSSNEQHEEHLLFIPDYEQHQKQQQHQQQQQRVLIVSSKNVTNSSSSSRRSISSNAMSMPSPYTATKIEDPTNESESKISKRTFLFVHVGKAGGSTIANNIRPLCQRKQNRESILQEKQFDKKRQQKEKEEREKKGGNGRQQKQNPFQLQMHNQFRTKNIPCLNNLNKQQSSNNEMILSSSSNSIIGYMHMNKKEYCDRNSDYGIKESNTFLVPIRDPISRLISAYNYHHPDNHHSRITCEQIQDRKTKILELNSNNPNNSISNSNSNSNNKYTYKMQISMVRLDLFYCQCFPTIYDLINIFNTSTNNNNSTSSDISYDNDTTISCKEMAELVIRGRSSVIIDDALNDNDNSNETTALLLKADNQYDIDLINDRKHSVMYYIGHITLNYGYYYRRTIQKYPTKDIVVIRCEDIWNDLQNIEYNLMNGNTTINGIDTGHTSQIHGSNNYKRNDTTLSLDEIQTLCCAIPTEIKIYKEVIQKSINLSNDEKQKSIQVINDKCGNLIDLC